MPTASFHVPAHPAVRSLSGSRPHPAPGAYAARRLEALASSLVASWSDLEDPQRRAMVRTIREAADELQAATALPASGRGRGRIGADPLGFLTPRELQVLDALSNGASTSDLATRFALSTSTVRSYIKSILNKLGVHSRLEAVALLRKLEAGTTAPDRAGWPGSSPRSA